MVDRGLISKFERSLSSQEGQVWFPVGASLWAPTQCRIQHHKKSVLHCIVTDQLHSARVFSLDIVPRAIVYVLHIARPRFTFGTSLPLAPWGLRMRLAVTDVASQTPNIMSFVGNKGCKLGLR
jgi:hypothetical protein